MGPIWKNNFFFFLIFKFSFSKVKNPKGACGWVRGRGEWGDKLITHVLSFSWNLMGVVGVGKLFTLSRIGKDHRILSTNIFNGFSFKLVRSEGRETVNQAPIVGDTCHHPKAKGCQNRRWDFSGGPCSYTSVADNYWSYPKTDAIMTRVTSRSLRCTFGKGNPCIWVSRLVLVCQRKRQVAGIILW